MPTAATGSRLVAIEPGYLQITTEEDTTGVEAHAVILASGARPDHSLAQRLAAKGVEVHEVGDCEAVGYIHGAMHAGHKVGRLL